MKRFRLALLLFPVLLGALAWGLKWRADNPSSTKEDLRLRALMLKPSKSDITLFPAVLGVGKIYSANLTKEELQPFVDSLNVLPQSSKLNEQVIYPTDTVIIVCEIDKPQRDGVESLSVSINFMNRQGKAHVGYSYQEIGYRLHPATTKRWLELLLNHPRIGPELRRRMKP